MTALPGDGRDFRTRLAEAAEHGDIDAVVVLDEQGR